MNWLAGLYHAHPALFALVAYYVGSSFISALPAPTAKSTMFYQFVFKFLNTLGANLARAYSSKVETSPNFQAAVELQKSGPQP